MRQRPALALASAALALAALTGPSLIRHFVTLPGLSAAGGPYRLHGTVGQVAGGPASGGHYNLRAGAFGPTFPPPARVCFPSTPGLYALPAPEPTAALFTVYLPLQARAALTGGASAAPATAPDLAVAFEYCPGQDNQPAALSITVSNVGDAATTTGFRVDAFVDFEQAPPPAAGWDAVCRSAPCRGAVWHVEALAPGAHVTLTHEAVALAHDAWLPKTVRSLYVYADTAASVGAGLGLVSERNELNNRGDWVAGAAPP